MKNYFKYIVLFIILITVGIIGINIYSNKTFQSSKKTQINTKVSKENSTKNKEEINKEEENKSSDTKNQETVENKQSNSQNQETTENKKTEENSSTQISSTSSNNQETASSKDPSTNESNSTSAEEPNYNILDVDDYSLSSQSQEIETYQKTISSKEINQNDENSSEQEVEILEIEDNFQESNTSNQETETSSKNTQSSSNNNSSDNKTTTINNNSNKNNSTATSTTSLSAKKKNFSHLNRYNQSGKYRNYSVCANGGNTIGGTACGLSSYMATRYILTGKDTDFLAFSREACRTGLYNGLGTSWGYTRSSGSIYPKKYGIVSKNVSIKQSTSNLYKRTIEELNKGNVVVPMIGCGYVTATSQIGGFNSTTGQHFIVIADYDPTKEKPFYVYNPTGINTGWTSKDKLKKYVLSKQCLKNYEVLSKK